MANNRVIIRINYDKDRRRKELIDPKMVTVWHKGRIFGAIAILLSLISLMFFWSPGKDVNQNNSNKQSALENDTQSKPIHTAAKAETIPEPMMSEQSSESLKSDTRIATAKQPSAIIYDKRVIRASLNKELRNGEPSQPVTMPVKLLPDQVLEIFYFSEIKRMKDQVLFHYWFKNGQLVYKKSFDVETDKFKLISSRKLTEKDIGEWQVTLIDQKGKHFSEANFLVNP